VTEVDSNERLVRLIIVEHWPEKWPGYSYGGRSESWEQILASAVRAQTKEVSVPQGTTIADVFKNPPK
jgi:hypothetical protein